MTFTSAAWWRVSKPNVSLASALSQIGTVQYQLHMQNLHAPVAEDVASKTLIEDLAQDV